MQRLTLVLGTLALATHAFAAWDVNVVQSNSTLAFPVTLITVPYVVQTNPVPQISFLTSIATPNPLIVGPAAGFSIGNFTAVYTVSDPTNTQPALNGFNLVITGFVFGSAQIGWSKQVFRRSDGQLLWQGNGVIQGAAAGGTDGAFALNIPVTLAVLASDVVVHEVFQIARGNDNDPFSFAGLTLVEQDWTVVPEPASLMALAAGLGSLRRRLRRC